MQIGKSGVVQCDHCGEMISGDCDSYTQGGVTSHFCPEGCLDEFFLEQFNDQIVEAAEERFQAELEAMKDEVCPGCRWRLRNFA